MTSKSLRKFAGATINADDLFTRYKIACDLKQPVDHDKIMLALQRWTDKIGIPDVPIKFVTTAKEVEVAARAARAAWAARAARAARDALTLGFASRQGWITHAADLLTVGLRDAYAAGMAVALPTGPQELGWAMVTP